MRIKMSNSHWLAGVDEKLFMQPRDLILRPTLKESGLHKSKDGYEYTVITKDDQNYAMIWVNEGQGLKVALAGDTVLSNCYIKSFRQEFESDDCIEVEEFDLKSYPVT